MNESKIRKIKLSIIGGVTIVILAVGAYAAWNFIIKIHNE